MKKLLLSCIACIAAISIANAQNAPLSIWGAGLDGSLYQQSVIYSDTSNGLEIQAPLTPSSVKLPISFNWRGGGVSPFLIKPNGNVGVQSDNPLSFFQVDDGCSKLNVGDASGTGLNYGTSYLGFNASRNGTNWSTSSDGGNNGGGAIYSSIFGDMYFSIIPTTGTSSDLSLTDANMVSNIALKISHTNGAVYAKQVYVQTTGFPDYVFKNDYKLMPLATVKTYIDQNHHLPEMPSAAVVEKDGLNIGEMNKLLTKKVEELTLHAIEQEERMKRMQQQLDELIKKSTAKN